MRLARQEVITYVSIMMALLTVIYLNQFLLGFNYLPGYKGLLVEYATPLRWLVYIAMILQSIITAVYIFVSESRLGRPSVNLWTLAGLVLGLIGFILYAAWNVMDKADLFLPEIISETEQSQSDN